MRFLILSLLALGLGAASECSAQSHAVPDSAALVRAVVQQITLTFHADSVPILLEPPASPFDSAVAQALSGTRSFRWPPRAHSVYGRWAGTRGVRFQGDTARVMFEMKGCERGKGMNFWRESWETLFVPEDSVWRFVRTLPYANADGVCGSNFHPR